MSRSRPNLGPSPSPSQTGFKLSPATIAKIEEAVTDYMAGLGGRAIIIKYGLSSIPEWNGFLSGLRRMGVDIPSSRIKRLSNEEWLEFRAFLQEKKRHLDRRPRQP